MSLSHWSPSLLLLPGIMSLMHIYCSQWRGCLPSPFRRAGHLISKQLFPYNTQNRVFHTGNRGALLMVWRLSSVQGSPPGSEAGEAPCKTSRREEVREAGETTGQDGAPGGGSTVQTAHSAIPPPWATFTRPQHLCAPPGTVPTWPVQHIIHAPRWFTCVQLAHTLCWPHAGPLQGSWSTPCTGPMLVHSRIADLMLTPCWSTPGQLVHALC